VKNEAYDLIHPAGKNITARINAGKVFQEIVQAAWQTGDPGLLFVDTTPSIEPLFAIAYRRSNVLEGRDLYEANAIFRNYAEQYHLDMDQIVSEITEKGTLNKVKMVPSVIRKNAGFKVRLYGIGPIDA
jgi:ribonucleotide reductase alpha subunit